jgi:quinol monooxygenase YgiN
MGEAFGMHDRLKAHPGQGDALEAVLLDAAEALRDDDQCLMYLVSRSLENPDDVWVTEFWTSQEAHGASLEREEVRAVIARGRPLIDGAPEATRLRPVGGKGL